MSEFIPAVPSTAIQVIGTDTTSQVARYLLADLSRYRIGNMVRQAAVAGTRALNLDSVSVPIDATIISNSPRVGWTKAATEYYSDKLTFENLAPMTSESSVAVDDIEKLLKKSRFSEVIPNLHKSLLIDGVGFVAFTPGDTSIGQPKYVASVLNGSECAVHIDRARNVDSALIMKGRRGMIWTPALVREFVLSDDGTNFIWGHEYANTLGFVPVVPFSLGGTFGSGRGVVSRAARDIEQDANRAMVYLNAARSYYSLPMRVWLNINQSLLTNEDGSQSQINGRPGSQTTIPIPSDFKDGDPEPSITQLNGASPQPILENLAVLSRLFAGDTLIPENDLLGSMSNPTSADALGVTEQRLNDRCERFIRTLQFGWQRLAYTVLRLQGYNDTDSRLLADDIRADYAKIERENPSARTDRMVKEISAGLRQPTSELTAKEIFGNDWQIGLAENLQAQRSALLQALASMDSKDEAAASSPVSPAE